MTFIEAIKLAKEKKAQIRRSHWKAWLFPTHETIEGALAEDWIVDGVEPTVSVTISQLEKAWNYDENAQPFAEFLKKAGINL